MQYQQEDKKKNFSCPVTNIGLSSCNVTSCMWNSSKYENNCSLNVSTISEYDLGEAKGYSISSVNKSVRKGKAEIIKLLTLDKYLTWIKDRKLKLIIKKKTYLREVYKNSQSSNNIFAINYKVFGAACLETLYSEFKETQPNLKQTKLSFLLGVRENKLKIIQNFIKVKK